MPVHDKNVKFDAVAIAPVRYGTPEMGALLAAIGESAAASKATGLDEHWRNIVTLSSHNPAAFKARAIGDYLVNGTQLPPNLYF